MKVIDAKSAGTRIQKRPAGAEARPRHHMLTKRLLKLHPRGVQRSRAYGAKRESKRQRNEGREIRTPNLLIWSQTRCRCAIPP